MSVKDVVTISVHVILVPRPALSPTCSAHVCLPSESLEASSGSGYVHTPSVQVSRAAVWPEPGVGSVRVGFTDALWPTWKLTTEAGSVALGTRVSSEIAIVR